MFASLIELTATYVEWTSIPLIGVIIRMHFRLMSLKERQALMEQQLGTLEKSCSRTEEVHHHTSHDVTRITEKVHQLEQDWS